MFETTAIREIRHRIYKSMYICTGVHRVSEVNTPIISTTTELVVNITV